jgi:ribonucleoside-diphosphate reductase beta chain
MTSNLLTPRIVYKPFEYPQAYDFWELQQQSHWIHSEIGMSNDINDWKQNINKSDKHLIGSILKGFTQSEVFIQDYWANNVSSWFKKPEIQMMSACFANMESVHQVSYAYLNDSLGFTDYTEFLSHEPTKKKIDRLIGKKAKSISDIALSLAVFSAFNEGVSLFSSFAILLNFSRFNLLKGVGQIISFSIRDESLHSNAGCWLFNTLVSENKEILTKEFTEKIYESAKLTYKLENDFIDSCFELGEPKGLKKDDLKEFIKYRINLKLQQIGFNSIYKVNQETIKNFEWFDVLTCGVGNTDFFASRVTDYSKGNKDFSKVCY